MKRNNTTLPSHRYHTWQRVHSRTVSPRRILSHTRCHLSGSVIRDTPHRQPCKSVDREWVTSNLLLPADKGGPDPPHLLAMVALRVLQSAVWRSSRVFNHLHPRSSALAAACAEITQAAPLARAVPRQQGFAALATRSVTRSATGDKGDPSHVAAVSDAALREKGLRLRLDVEASALIDAHREALRAVLAAIQHIPEASERDVRLVKTEIARLGDGFFMLVVAGEYNAGKSSLINALLGRDVLPEGPTPTTAKVTKLKYADQSSSPYMDEHGVLVRGEPVRVLASRLQIVDTPGTNAIDRSHEALTKEFLPLCDIVLFVTSADRPFSESERLFLESIRTWG